jgi:carbon storage regulator
MLVFTRKTGDGIRVGKHIELKVLSVSGGTVRLGIEAPDDVRIHRKEILVKLGQAIDENLLVAAGR